MKTCGDVYLHCDELIGANSWLSFPILSVGERMSFRLTLSSIRKGYGLEDRVLDIDSPDFIANMKLAFGDTDKCTS
jgi:hypothetical protein